MTERRVVSTYDPGIFDVNNIDEAKQIILTPEGMSSEERWERETPYLVDLLAEHITLDKSSLVIDYGCGIGRLSKALIDRFGCRVVGVDISVSMRGFAHAYVNSDRFFSCAPIWLRFFAPSPLWRADVAISVWTLQHCLEPSEDIAIIKGSLGEGGKIFVVNNNQRVVPTRECGWLDDKKDISALLNTSFHQLARGMLDVRIVAQELANCTSWATYRAQ